MSKSEGAIEPLGLSIKKTAEVTGESEWAVKNKLRHGIYRGRKSGRRTIVIYESVKTAWESLPAAKFAAPRERRRRVA